MEFFDPETVGKFFDIAIFSRSEAHIGKAPNSQSIIIKARYPDSLAIMIKDDQKRTDTPIPSQGTITFKSYNILFEFTYHLHKKSTNATPLIAFPTMIRYADRRKCARLLFDSRENKIFNLWCERNKLRFNAMIYNLCSDGIGFFVLDQTVSIKTNDLIYIDDVLLGQKRTAFIKITHVHDNICGGPFTDTSDAFKIALKKDIFNEILWRSEQHLRLLKEKSEVAERIHAAQEERAQKKENVLNYLDLINPFLESVISVLDQFLDLPVKREELEFKTITSGRYDATTFINCSADTFQFQFFLCLEQAVLLGITEKLTGIRPEEIDDATRDLLGELGNMIVGNAKKDISDSLRYQLSAPGLIIGKRHVLSTLSRYPAIRISFSSSIGPLDIVLFISDVIRKKNPCSRIDLTIDPHDAMHFIEPLYNSTINLFSNYLDLSIKEKSINIRSPLTPKFEVSAFLAFESEDLEGQVVLNMTESLARHIYHRLVQEEATELTDQVKDSIGEILNMITGNAKEEFCQSGLYYHMSTPFVVMGKDQFIKTIGDIPFVSSMYWTSEGFFELSFSLASRKNH